MLQNCFLPVERLTCDLWSGLGYSGGIFGFKKKIIMVRLQAWGTRHIHTYVHIWRFVFVLVTFPEFLIHHERVVWSVGCGPETESNLGASLLLNRWFCSCNCVNATKPPNFCCVILVEKVDCAVSRDENTINWKRIIGTLLYYKPNQTKILVTLCPFSSDFAQPCVVLERSEFLFCKYLCRN